MNTSINSSVSRQDKNSCSQYLDQTISFGCPHAFVLCKAEPHQRESLHNNPVDALMHTCSHCHLHRKYGNRSANISQYPGKERYNENKETNHVSPKKKCFHHRSVLQTNKRFLGNLSVVFTLGEGLCVRQTSCG